MSAAKDSARWTSWALALTPVVVLVACGGGDGDMTAREITDEELRLMVLTQDELGEEYADFALDAENSGFESNEARISESCDPRDERDDVESYGRRNGFTQTHASDDAAVQLRVTLFEDPSGASGSFTDDVEDVRRQVGESCEDVVITDIEEFEVVGIADESLGVVLTATVGDADDDGGTLYQTVVGFRLGRIVASARFTGFDSADAKPEVTVLARKLDERIRAVLQEGNGP